MIIAIVNCIDKANPGEEGDMSNVQISRQVESGRRGKSVKQERMGKQTVIIVVVLVAMLCLALLLSHGLQPIRLYACHLTTQIKWINFFRLKKYQNLLKKKQMILIDHYQLKILIYNYKLLNKEIRLRSIHSEFTYPFGKKSNSASLLQEQMIDKMKTIPTYLMNPVFP